MIAPQQALPVTRQCQVLKLAKSTPYYRPVPVSERDLVLMRRMDEYHLDYLHAYASVSEARAGLDKYFRFYNTFRTHQSLDRKTPDAIYFNHATDLRSAA